MTANESTDLQPYSDEDQAFLDRLEAAKQREPGAFEALMVAYEPTTKTAIANILINQDDRDDCYQEFLEKIWGKLDAFQLVNNYPANSFGAWLKIAAKRKALDYQEKASFRTPKGGFVRAWYPDQQGDDDPLASTTVVVPDEGFEDDLLSQDSASELLKALQRTAAGMPEMQAFVFMRFAVQQQSYSEIAEAATEKFGRPVSVAAVKGLMHRARKTMQDVPKRLKSALRWRAYMTQVRADPERYALWLKKQRINNRRRFSDPTKRAARQKYNREYGKRYRKTDRGREAHRAAVRKYRAKQEAINPGWWDKYTERFRQARAEGRYKTDWKAVRLNDPERYERKLAYDRERNRRLAAERRAADPVPLAAKLAHQRKFTDDQVREIRRRRAAGEKAKDLGVEFGVTDEAIGQVARRVTYKWVED